jgi:ribosomal-protein-alanine N-acetyltransferase
MEKGEKTSRIPMPLPLYKSRLLIRRNIAEDVEAAYWIYSDPEVKRFLSNGQPDSYEKVRQRILGRAEFEAQFGVTIWAVVEKASGEMIGSCGLFPAEGKGPEIEIAYHFRRDVWGKGYATEAAAVCLDYGINELKLPRIIGLVDEENIASSRVLEKIGMVREGKGRYYERELMVYAAEGMRGEG